MARRISLADLVAWAGLALAQLVTFLLFALPAWRRLVPASLAVPGDFTCFRTGGRLLAAGLPFKPAALDAVCAYMYPPPFLLLAAPLGWLGALAGYRLWCGAGLALLAAGAWVAGLRGWRLLLGLASPAVTYAVYTGQVGLISSALMLGAFALAETAPWTAGLLAGCLVIKPHLALLLPVCFAAGRHGSAFLAASLTALALAAVSFLCFGALPWQFYTGHELAASHEVLMMPWPQPYQGIMISPFMFLRALGAGQTLAWVAQAAVTLACALAAWRLWRTTGPNPARLALSLCLAFLATPYDYIYDLPCLGVALALLPGRAGLGLSAAFAVAVAGYIPLAMVSLPAGALMLAVLALRLRPTMPAPHLEAHPRPARTTT